MRPFRRSMFRHDPPLNPPPQRDDCDPRVYGDGMGGTPAPEQRVDGMTASELKVAMGFHPDDPNVEVVFVPMHGAYRDGNKQDPLDKLRSCLDFERRCEDEALASIPVPPSTPYPEPRAETTEEKLARLMPAINEVVAEARGALIKAITKHRPMAGPHEGYAVILEELEELWDEIKLDGGGHDTAARKEASQVAAMGMRYMLDIDPR